MRHPRGIDLVAPIKPARYEEFVPSKSVFETISTLREWEVLGARCGQCGHTAWVDKSKILRQYGNDYLHNLGRRLVCRCGNRQDNTLMIGRLGRD